MLLGESLITLIFFRFRFFISRICFYHIFVLQNTHTMRGKVIEIELSRKNFYLSYYIRKMVYLPICLQYLITSGNSSHLVK